METVTLSIGRNIGDHPMPAAEWENATADILRIARANVGHGAVYFAGFGDGIYLGDGEESFTVVASLPIYNRDRVRREIATLCVRYRQEAIAMTYGATELVREWSA